MAMKLLRFRITADDILAVVHLDTTQIIDANPDPLYVVVHWFPRNAEGLSGVALRTWIMDELRRRCPVQLDALHKALAARDEAYGTVLPSEGQDL